MDILWAPWRMEYIKSPRKFTSSCVFCEKLHDNRDRENLLLYRSSHAFVIMNPFPYSNGHLMVLPNDHVPDMSRLSDEVLLDFIKTMHFCLDCLQSSLMPEGFNVGINFGKVAGAGLGEHMHLHIVPRWVGDASFITVIGETRVIPEHVTKTYDMLVDIFQGRSSI
jgi:ATP adenylyltransferase